VRKIEEAGDGGDVNECGAANEVCCRTVGVGLRHVRRTPRRAAGFPVAGDPPDISENWCGGAYFRLRGAVLGGRQAVHEKRSAAAISLVPAAFLGHREGFFRSSPDLRALVDPPR
jgi:hypothetical protein